MVKIKPKKASVKDRSFFMLCLSSLYDIDFTYNQKDWAPVSEECLEAICFSRPESFFPGQELSISWKPKLCSYGWL